MALATQRDTWRRLAVLALAALCTSWSDAIVIAEEISPPLLLSDIGAPTHLADTNLPYITRQRIAAVNPTAFDGLTTNDSYCVMLNVFDDLSLTARVESVDRRTVDSFTCSGTLLNEQAGWFVIAVEDDAVIAEIWSASHGSFEIRSIHDTDHVMVRQIDADRLGGCANGPEQTNVQTPSNRNQGTVGGSEAPAAVKLCEQNVDVLVVYTPAALNSLGSDSAMRAFAQACVASSNISSQNSNISPRMRLVGTEFVNYVESTSLAIDLARMQSPFDGFLDDVPTLRQQHGADLVALIVESNASGCGIGYVMTEPSESFAPFGMSVIQQSCALGNLSFAHELAHNYGCQHDHSDASIGAFPYSHGLRFTGVSGQEWRTIMASTPGVRIPYFSNPNVIFDGAATGIPEDRPELGPPADNSRSIFNTSNFVGRFVIPPIIDCNNTGFDDACDIMLGFSADANENGVPDECDALPCASVELSRLVPTNARSFDRFGGSVSMSDDRVVVGAMMNDHTGIDGGAAYVFDLKNPTQPVVLHPDDPAIFQWFGAAVAMSPDGNVILVGAPRDGFEISDVGAAYIFRFDGTNWVQDAKLPNPDPQQSERFGWSVAWAGERNGQLSAVIGTIFDNEAAFTAGAVYVYEQTESGWGPPIKLMADDAAIGDRIGHAVAASRDGNRVIAGAPNADAGAMNSGAGYVFRREGTAWIQEAKLVAGDPRAEARFGWSVAIDGPRAVVGAIRDNQFGDRAGAAYVFRRDDSIIGPSWMQEIKLVAADAGLHKQFGSSVAMRGNQAVIGSILDTTAGSIGGSVFVFNRNDGAWVQQAKIAPHDGAGYDNFGVATAMAPSARLAAVGAYFDDHLGLIDVGTVSIVSTLESARDCNGNGIDDSCDIDNNTSDDANRNGIPDECDTPACLFDIAGEDGNVGVPDLLAVINHWGPCDATCPLVSCTADIIGDCTVGIADLLEVISNWGECERD